MGSAGGVVIIIALVGAYIWYSVWRQKGIRPRTVQTKLEPQQLRSIFEDKVARTGWKVIDDGNPIVAQSSLAGGIRQQIALQTERSGDMTNANIAPTRVVKKLLGQPTKAHTLRMRLNSFVSAVQAADPSARIS